MTMNRREMLHFLAATGVLLLRGGIMNANEQKSGAASAVDHLLLGAPDLDEGIRWVEERSGIQAVIGGVHPGMGTRNALLSLGGRRYLEIIAPDPAQESYNFQVDVRTLKEPGLITWAASTSNIDSLAKTARSGNYQMYGPSDGSRNKPDGTTLRWKILFLQTDFGGEIVQPFPFFIQWADDSIHPSQDCPKGCELESLVMEHPRPNDLRNALQQMGIEAEVRGAQAARLIATIHTPKGKLTLD